eukprot:gene40717-53731_t
MLARLKKPFGKTGSVGLTLSATNAIKTIIPGGAADKAGLQVGDVVLKVDNPRGPHEVTDTDSILREIGPEGHVFEGVTIVLRVLRPGKAPPKPKPAPKGKKPGGKKKDSASEEEVAVPGTEIDLKLTMAPISAGAKASRLKNLEQTKGKVFGKKFNAQRAFEMENDPDACRMTLRGAFNECDEDGSGSLDLDECRQVAKRLGVPEPDPNIEADADLSGELEFDEFYPSLRELFMDIIYG